jgi:hypothetical protein
VFALVVNFTAQSQEFAVDTIMRNGKPWELLNFTFVSEGYRQKEMDKFISDVNRISDYLFTQNPLKEYKNYFNVYAIKVPCNWSN